MPRLFTPALWPGAQCPETQVHGPGRAWHQHRGQQPLVQLLELRPRAEILVGGLVTGWALVLPGGSTGCPKGPWRGGGLAGWAPGRQRRAPQEARGPHTLLCQVLLLCQEGGLKLALNGQGLGATSLGRQVLERLRELRVSGTIQLYCVHH